MRGPGRAILATLVVLALLVVAADVGLRLLTERWLEGRVRETLALAARPDVGIGGFPFLSQFARGRFERVEVTLRDLEVEGVRLEEATLGLRNVRFDQADVLAGRPGSIRVGTGGAVVEIGEESLNELLRSQGHPVTVELLGPRVRVSAGVEVAGQELTASAVGRARLEGRSVVFEPTEIEVDGGIPLPAGLLSFSVELPALLEGISYESLEVREAVLAVRANLDDTVLDLR